MAVTPSPPPQQQYGLNPSGQGSAYNPAGMPQYGAQPMGNMTPQSRWRTGYPPMQPVDDDVIPTAIVIKNIPFAVTRDHLLGVIESLGAPVPYAFNYHHDNGVFRGLAFANFRAPEEAASVVAALNGYDVQGRKLRVEYKKVLQPGEKDKIEREKALKRMKSVQFDREMMPPPINVPPIHTNGHHLMNMHDNSPPQSASSASSEVLPMTLDLNDPMALDIYSRLLVFKEDRMRDELAFSRNLSPVERRIVHLVAQKLGLSSQTKLEGDHKTVVVTRDHNRPNLTTTTSATVTSSYLSPYSATPSGEVSPSLRIKKSMPDLRGFNGPIVARDPSRSLTPQRSSGNLREQRDYASMGAAQGRKNGFGSGNFGHFFSQDAPPVPPLPANMNLHRTSVPSLNGASSPVDGDLAQPQPLRNPRGPSGESRGFGLRTSQSTILRGSNGAGVIGRRVEEESDDGQIEGTRTRESLEI
jgi:RNA recognition motif-containing protein